MKKTALLAMGLGASLIASTASALTIYTNDFDGNVVTDNGASVVSGFTNGQIKNVGSGTTYAPNWEDKYFRNKSVNPIEESELSLSGIQTGFGLTASFTLGFLDTFDRAIGTWGPDFIDIYVDDGTTKTVLASLQNTADSGVGYLADPIATNVDVQQNGNRNDNAALDDLFNVTVGWVSSAADLVFGITARGPNWQGGNDESWGIDSFSLAYEPGSDIAAVPLPAAAWLFGTALAGLAGFRRFKKTA